MKIVLKPVTLWVIIKQMSKENKYKYEAQNA